jgi:heptosyltransferase-2
MAGALMNYMNDSAPMHLASAINAPTTAIFCSTIPAFGFGPLADDRAVIESDQKLACRPCGIHGSKDCPEKHFDCAEKISVKSLVARLP